MEKSPKDTATTENNTSSVVGSWDALYEIGNKDADGNVSSGAVRIDAGHGNLIHAKGIRVSVHGVDDLLVIANGSEIMILPRGTSQKVRDFAKE